MNDNQRKLLETLLKTDVYKTGHRTLYPKNLTKVFSNFTPRSNNWTNLKDKEGNKVDTIVAFGMEHVIKTISNEFVDRLSNLYTNESIEVVDKYKKVIQETTNQTNFNVEHLYELFLYINEHEKLPIEVRAVEEGAIVKYGQPILTIHNTDNKFAWIVNYLETWISSMLWPICTSASTAHYIKTILLKYAKRTGTPEEFVDYQAHDFSLRGDMGIEAAKLIGMGHLHFFKGSDNLPAILQKSGSSVIATEHSIMCAGTKEGEFDTYKRLILENPRGILSIVSDTWNIYNVCDVIIPSLKEEIFARNGKLVIRPDSGDAIKVLFGGLELTHPLANDKDKENANLGLFKIIEKHFGYTLNEKGFKILPIGFLWGDGITVDNIENIFATMESHGYASENLIVGVGSYTYQYVTRDTAGFAMKATYIEVKQEDNSIKGINIHKDPITDSGIKKSASGLLAIINDSLIENTTWETVYSNKNKLKKIY